MHVKMNHDKLSNGDEKTRYPDRSRDLFGVQLEVSIYSKKIH